MDLITCTLIIIIGLNLRTKVQNLHIQLLLLLLQGVFALWVQLTLDAESTQRFSCDILQAQRGRVGGIPIQDPSWTHGPGWSDCKKRAIKLPLLIPLFCLECGPHNYETLISLEEGQSETITTPGFPSPYPNEATLLWDFESVGTDGTLHVTVAYLQVVKIFVLLANTYVPTTAFKYQLEDGVDFFRLYNGFHLCQNNTLVEELTGSIEGGSFSWTSTSPKMSLVFMSDRSVTAAGFEVTVTAGRKTE